MADHPAAPLLAADLGRLQHTNNRGEVGMVHLPGFVSTAGMSEEQAGESGMLAQAISEAVIETLEQRYKYRVIHESDIKAQVKAAVAEQAAPVEKVPLRCKRCNTALMNVYVGDNRVDAKVFVGVLQQHLEVCS
ncbi:MAG: hypothetical protein WBB07_17545 [Mycobacterium sp.]